MRIAILGSLLIGSSKQAISIIEGERRAYYSWNWGSGSYGPDGANTGVAFTGLIGMSAAISGYTPVH